MKEFFGGIVGGFIIIAFFMLIIFSTNIFSYKIVILKGNNISSVEKDSSKSKLLTELQHENVIVTPQEFTNNIVNYYNTALTILTALLVLFSVVSYIHLRFISKEQMKVVFKDTMRDSKEFHTMVEDSIFGKAEEKFASAELVDKMVENVEGVLVRLEQLEGLELFGSVDSEISEDEMHKN